MKEKEAAINANYYALPKFLHPVVITFVRLPPTMTWGLTTGAFPCSG